MKRSYYKQLDQIEKSVMWIRKYVNQKEIVENSHNLILQRLHNIKRDLLSIKHFKEFSDQEVDKNRNK